MSSFSTSFSSLSFEKRARSNHEKASTSKKKLFIHRVIEHSDYEPNKDQQPFPIPFPKAPYPSQENVGSWENVAIKNNQMVLHILKNREQIESQGRSESKKILASKEACVKSKLSYHIVKFEQSIKKHNSIFVKYHKVNEDLIKKSEFRTRHFFKYNTPKEIPKASLMLTFNQLTDRQKNKKFKEIVYKVISKIQIEKMSQFNKTETNKNLDIEELKNIETEETIDTSTSIVKPPGQNTTKIDDAILQRSVKYRKYVELLHQCPLIQTLSLVRIPLRAYDKELLKQISLEQDKETFRYLPHFEESFEKDVPLYHYHISPSKWSEYNKMIGKLSAAMKRPSKPRLFPISNNEAEKNKGQSSQSSNNWNKFQVIGTVTASVKKKNQIKNQKDVLIKDVRPF